MSHATPIPENNGERAAKFTVAAIVLFVMAVVAVAVLDRREGPSVPNAVSAPEPPPGPEGVITYQVAGEGFFLAKASGEPLGPAGNHDLHAVRDATGAERVTSPDGGLATRIDRDDSGVWLAVGAPGAETRLTQLAGPSDPALVDGGKGHAREVEGIPLVVAWSPDSTRLAYGSITGEPWMLQIVAPGGVPEFRYYQVGGGYIGELAWSPDGRYLAISTYALDRSTHTVLLLDTKTGILTRLSDGCHLTWSPDSKYLAIHRDPGPETGAWVISVDGETRFPISTDPAAYPYTWRQT